VNPVEAFAVGIAPHHLPALLAALLLPVLVWAARRLRGPAGARPAAGPGATAGPGVAACAVAAPPRPLTDRWAAGLLGVAGAVHLALPLGHLDGPLLTMGFVGSGVAYAWLALRALEGRPWRLFATPLLLGTLVTYLVAVTAGLGGAGGEEPDQVGIATALAELAVLGLCLVPARAPGAGRALGRAAGSVATVLIALVTGAVIWAGSLASHTAGGAVPAGSAVAATATTGSASVGHAGGHEHDHAHAARAQAGIVMRPHTAHAATAAQAEAARRLAAATAKATRRFADLRTALDAGYTLPANATGTDVHLEHKRYQGDGRILDPARPEMLVYAISGGRATLLGVVYVMERAGTPGPEPGGPITQWHAHNLCLTLLPPGFGGVSPFGGCPALSVAVTIPEMMHVWVVDSPVGPFAEGLDKTWASDYHRSHGRPISAG
jgi:hypothetical protein